MNTVVVRFRLEQSIADSFVWWLRSDYHILLVVFFKPSITIFFFLQYFNDIMWMIFLIQQNIAWWFYQCTFVLVKFSLLLYLYSFEVFFIFACWCFFFLFNLNFRTCGFIVWFLTFVFALPNYSASIFGVFHSVILFIYIKLLKDTNLEHLSC